jgi:hypothetical protein
MYAGEGNHTPAPQTIHTSNGRRMYAREGNHTPAPQTTCMCACGEVQCERLRLREEVWCERELGKSLEISVVNPVALCWLNNCVVSCAGLPG